MRPFLIRRRNWTRAPLRYDASFHRITLSSMGEMSMSSAVPTGIRTPRATPLVLETKPTAGGKTIAPIQPPVVTRLMAVPTRDGKYVPASPTAVGKIAAMNAPAAKVEMATKTRLRRANMPPRHTNDPAALTSSNRSGPSAERVHWLDQRPAIIARAKAEIILEAIF